MMYKASAEPVDSVQNSARDHDKHTFGEIPSSGPTNQRSIDTSENEKNLWLFSSRLRRHWWFVLLERRESQGSGVGFMYVCIRVEVSDIIHHHSESE